MLKSLLLVLALFVAAPLSAQTVSQTRAQVPPGTTLQSAVSGNANGTAAVVSGYSSFMMSVTASVAMSGGTTINFECQSNGTFAAVSALKLGTTTVGTTTTTTGDYQVSVGSYLTCRARISAYSAGTMTIIGYPSVLAPVSYTITSAAGGGSAVTIIDGGDVTQGTTTDARSTATDATGVTLMQVFKEISFMEQTPASRAVTNAGTFAVQVAGVSTAAKQPALGTAGTASTDVITVQGIASMTKLLVTPDSVALPANQSVNVAQINGVTTLMGNGVTGTGSQRVTVASDNTPFHTIIDTTSTTAVTQATGTNLHAVLDTTSTTAVTQATGTNLHAVLDTTSTTAVTQATATNLNAAVVGTGTAGSAAGGILTVQGVASMTKLLVTPDSVALPANQSVNLAQVAGTTTVNGGLAGSQSVGGTVATNVAISANPLNLGAQAVSSENAVVTTARQVQLVADLVGKLIVLPYANPENFVSGLTAAMTGTTTTSIVAAPASGLRNYLTHIICTNSHATVGTFVIVQDGSGGTTYYEGYAAAVGGGFSITFPTPLRQPTTATAVFVADVTTGANVICAASGYKGA